MSDYKMIENEVDQLEGLIWDMASDVWSFAELSYEEFESSALESSALQKHGFEIEQRAIGGLDTSWIATWGNGAPVVGFLVEFDALPGLGNDTVPSKTPAQNGNTNGHGCGHNLIGSSSIGAAIALKRHMEKNGIPGTIKVFGCPAEEALNGKNYMAAAGVFDGLDVCLHNHPAMVNTVVNFHSTAAIDLWIEWHGVTSHAGTSPWEGRSALHAAEIFLVSANMMREQMEPTSRLHYQVLNGGEAVNVIPDYAKVHVRYRGKNARDVRKYKAWLEDMAKGAGLATQTQASVTNLGGIYDSLPNDVLASAMNQHVERYLPIDWTEEEQAFARAIQREMGKPEEGLATDILPLPTGIEVGGSSDVGDVSWLVPTMGVVYASWPKHIPPHQWGCTACNGMSIGRKAGLQAAKVMAAQGLELMTNPALIDAAKAEFEKQKGGETYRSLNDVESNPRGSLDTDQIAHFECCLHAAMEHFGVDETHD
ncbi:amidohydrolase [Ferrimonas balearica]|uniref:amidohydrolase n=1 Tax=Ferrimonas balearica TaxID=44012 RepID=UPI001F200D90|nr:amidohydrolase [Ferrimonas balearica]MBY6016188.1 amidohydrolase [Halomonas denitrificans]MBY6095543.1 amidohydrolase [Ferrimonas balearica]